MVRNWWTASLAAALAVMGCDRDSPPKPSEEPPARPKFVPPADSELAALLGLDAGEVEINRPDPTSAAGDLKGEVEAFTDLDACVRSRSALDPVVGDAVDALGYTTLLRDACRVIEAIKTRSVEACAPIVSSSLRDRCWMSVAVATGDLLMCPMTLQNHDPMCVALARRDPGLCSHVLPDRRTTCRAMLSRDVGKCGGDAGCRRMAERWKGLIPDPRGGAALHTKVRLEVTGRGEGGTGKPLSLDLSQQVPAAIVVRNMGTTRILFGEQTEAQWPTHLTAPQPRVSMVLSAPAESLKQGVHSFGGDVLAFEILVPKVGTLSTKTEHSPATMTVDVVETDIGSPVRFSVEADLGEEANGFHVRLEVNTYVRDLVVTKRP